MQTTTLCAAVVAVGKSLVTKSLTTKSLVIKSLVTKSPVTKSPVTKSLVTKSLVTKSLVAKSVLTMTFLTVSFDTRAAEDLHSARAMLPFCKLSEKQSMANTRNAMMYGQCFGMVSGVVMMTEVLRQARAAGKAELDPVLCVEIPPDTTILQLIDAVVKYGESHPDQAGERFEAVAFGAFRSAWPCGK